MNKKLNDTTKTLISNLFKILSDPTRLSILDALKGKELTVTELTDELAMSQSSISHQLKTLRESNLVKFRRNGKEVIYSLSDNHVNSILDQAIEHVKEEGI